MACQDDLDDSDPRDEIVRLEEHIEQLAGKFESCRKFILAARIAVAGGGVVLAAMLVGLGRVPAKSRTETAAWFSALCGLKPGIFPRSSPPQHGP